MVFEIMITIKDKIGISIYTADFIAPNIIVLRLIEYRAGYIKDLVQKFVELLEEELPHNSIVHIIKVFNREFYENGLLSHDDYDKAYDNLLYLNQTWKRTYDIDVVPNVTLGYEINTDRRKPPKDDTAININVKTFEEALEIVKDYNIKHKIE